jgi:molybdenum cofactor biosynthesis enzyme MoaA
MKIEDFEIFKFGENEYSTFNNNKTYLLNKHPYLDIVLTDHCNSNCNFCIADLIHNKLNCDINIFKEKILYAIEKMNVNEVLLLGGEPTVSKHLIPLIKWLSDINLLDKIVMTTNGIRLANDEKYRKELFESGLTHINISYMSQFKDQQQKINNTNHYISLGDIRRIYLDAKKYNVNLRINNNIFKSNNDNLKDLLTFYNNIKDSCDSIKFSPILEVDDFSVVNKKIKWAKENRLDDEHILNLFNSIHEYFSNAHNISIIENDLQFGFVKNSLIPLKTPIILNWNFGDFTGMMKKVKEENKINNIKLLPNNELSLSWNRELEEYFIKTN